MIEFNWSFPNFEVNSENEVKTIHWRYTAIDGDYSASMYGSCAGSEGMDFDAMTQEHAIMCVTENQPVEDMQSNLSAQIEAQKNPETTSMTKEW